MSRRVYMATQENLPAMLENFCADMTDLVNDDIMQKRLELCAEEIIVNVVNYAYEDEAGSIEVELTYDEKTRRFSMIFMDDGKPYNPLENSNGHDYDDLDAAKIGGLGIYLYTKIMDGQSYQYKDGKNCLTLWKIV